ncbi:MAG TPA: hypothetical protein PLK12_02015 [Prolixibacteraceae bacterium]|nr:hypothetical protein [Prolixibacteraceae bacterium]
MKTIESKLIVTGILFLLMLVTGVVVKKAGKPYPVVLLSIHKIISLLAAVSAVLTVIQLYRQVESGFWVWLLMVVSGLVFMLSFSSGTILSIEKKEAGDAAQQEAEEAPMKRMHRVAPILATVLIALTFFLMYKGWI